MGARHGADPQHPFLPTGGGHAVVEPTAARLARAGVGGEGEEEGEENHLNG